MTTDRPASVPVGPTGLVPPSAGQCGVRNGNRPPCGVPAGLVALINECVACRYADLGECQGHPVCEAHAAALRAGSLAWHTDLPDAPRPRVERMHTLAAS